MIARLITAEGEERKVTIKTFDDAKKLICYEGYKSPLEIINIQGAKMMLLDEEGKLKNLPMNNLATEIAHEEEAIYPSDFICGDVLIIEDVEEFDSLPIE